MLAPFFLATILFGSAHGVSEPCRRVWTSTVSNRVLSGPLVKLGRNFGLDQCRGACDNEYDDGGFPCKSIVYKPKSRTCFVSESTAAPANPLLPKRKHIFSGTTEVCPGCEFQWSDREDERKLGGKITAETIKGITETECKQRCVDESDYHCAAINYNKRKSKCSLLTANRFVVPALYGPNKRFVHYDRVLVCEDEELSWGYAGQDNVIVAEDWPEKWPTCGGYSQSPIMLDNTPHNWEEHSMSEDPVIFLPHTYNGSFTATNTGQTLQVKVPDSADFLMTSSLLSGTYKLDHFDFHWGSDSLDGAEHPWDFPYYAVEMQYVHYKTSFKSFAEAKSQPGGVAIVARRFADDTDPNRFSPGEPRYLRFIEDIAPALIEPGTEVEFQLPLEIFELGYITDFLTYEGSLTTPPCYETVTWIVEDNQEPVTAETLAALRTLQTRNGEPLQDNFRPVQPLNGRTVRHYG